MFRFSMLFAFLSCLLLPLQLADNTPFGMLLGSSHGVDGFSNYNSSVITEEDNFLNGVFMGMKWQCVEYARRYLYMTRGLTFGSIRAAYDIWDLPTLQNVSTGQQYKFIQYRNGEATSLPKEGDLLIWPQQGTDTPFGHVAVVVGLKYTAQDFQVLIAEQNFLNDKWQNPTSYARALIGSVDGQRYTVADPGYEITGWLSVGPMVWEPEPNKVAPSWDYPMLGLLGLPVFITVIGLVLLAYRRKVEGAALRQNDGHLLLDEDPVIEAPPHHGGSAEELELENVR